VVYLMTCSRSDRTDPERRQKSYRVLMCLIMVMFALQTVHNIINWYNMWLAFIDYGDNIDGSFLVLLGLDTGTTSSQFAIFAVQELLVTFRLGIADSILVNLKLFSNFTYPLTANTVGLAVLDHLQSKLEGDNCTIDFTYWFCRYVLAITCFCSSTDNLTRCQHCSVCSRSPPLSGIIWRRLEHHNLYPICWVHRPVNGSNCCSNSESIANARSLTPTPIRSGNHRRIIGLVFNFGYNHDHNVSFTP
jgi:hypothetical protein